MAKSKFLRICCPRCNNCQIIYGKASLKVKCKKCGYLLVRTGGGKVKVRAQIKEVIH